MEGWVKDRRRCEQAKVVGKHLEGAGGRGRERSLPCRKVGGEVREVRSKIHFMFQATKMLLSSSIVCTSQTAAVLIII